jgi:hypothetical protein
MPTSGRAPAINELRGVVKRNAPSAIEGLSAEFQEFADELTKGVVLGPEVGPEDNRAFVERRAMLAVRLGNEVVSIVSRRIEQVKQKAASRRKRKIVLLTLGGVSGAGTLGALGASPEFAGRIGAAITSFVAIGNSIHEFLVRQGEEKLSDVVLKLTKAKYELTVYCGELEAAVKERIDIEQLTELINKANSVAGELSGESAGLGV